MKSVKAIIIFGSSATVGADVNSDIDVCVITEENFDLQYLIEILMEKIPRVSIDKLEPISYSELQFNQMLAKGSLFLHHLKDEGNCIVGIEFFKNKMKTLNKFSSFFEELEYYNEIFEEINLEIHKGNKETEFDASILFTLTRNVCILICNFNKEPFYGRRNAFEYCLKNYTNFPLTQKTYTSLELLKLLYDRGAYFEKSRENLFDYNEAIQEVHLLLLFAKNIFSSEYEINTITNKFYELKNISSFGYKERIILEKSLFSILKLAAGKEVTGFSRLEFQNLNFKFLNNKVRLRLILKIFELRRFLVF